MSLSYEVLLQLASTWRVHEREALDRLGELFRVETGCRLLTMTAVDMARPQPLVRIWTSLPEMYRTGETKSFGNNSDEWYKQVMIHYLPAVFAGPEDLARMLPNDYKALAALGCNSGVNVPVVVRGALVGLVNLFGDADWLGSVSQERLQALTVLTHGAFLGRSTQR